MSDNHPKTVKDLIEYLQAEVKERPEVAQMPVKIPMHSVTQKYASAVVDIAFIEGGYGALCLYAYLPDGMYIGERKKKE